MNKGLLGTDTLSEFLKGIDESVAAQGTGYRTIFGRFTVSAITAMEIVRGLQQKQVPGRLQTFLTTIAAGEILPFDLPAAELAGRIAGDLHRSGRPIGVTDPMIAAIALTHDLELVTGNAAHFRHIQQLGYPLILKNWRA